MNYVTLDFDATLRRMARERDLTVSRICGTIEFKGANVCLVNIRMQIGDHEAEMECLNEQTFEEDAAKMFKSYFHVPEWMYRDIALAHIDGRDFDLWIDGLHVFAEAGRLHDLYTDRMMAGEGWEDVWNDFDTDTLQVIYNRLRDAQEADDEARYETERHLIINN